MHPDGKGVHTLAPHRHDGFHAGSGGAAVVEDAGQDAGLRGLDVAHLKIEGPGLQGGGGRYGNRGQGGVRYVRIECIVECTLPGMELP